ncbi:helix-turn-helix transcriptional regulator [Streptomyces sp. URMC 126]|uniref:helix-turn-helix transcriptional regulator n=1 Tax=Streptomyces sp. URMC 126 TaxID=3423401 RepID=UPI003F1DF3F6
MRGSVAAVGGRPWDGAVLLEPGWLVFLGWFATAPAHLHSAWQLLLAAEGEVTLRTPEGAERTLTAAVIPARAPHVTVAHRARGVMLWLDARSAAAQALDARFAGPRAGRGPADRASVAAWAEAGGAFAGPAGDLVRGLSPATATRGELTDALRPLLAAVGDLPGAAVAPRPRHPALSDALALLPRLTGGPVTLGQLAAEVGLSASRLGRLFTRELGLSFTDCRRWARLRRAMEEVRHGASLTHAASAAGFTDSAHLTRVTREMFGLSPSFLATSVRWL